MKEVLISADELKRFEACEVTLYAYQRVDGLCPVCERAMLLSGLICPNCGYDNSTPVEKWKQMHENKE